MDRYRHVNPRHITPLHGTYKSREHHLRELVARMAAGGWYGRPLVVEETLPNRYQAWTGTHRLAAALTVGMPHVPVVLINKDRWIRRWGKPARLFVDEVGDDIDKYSALQEAGDLIAARVMQREVELNLGGDAQRCGIGVDAHRCL